MGAKRARLESLKASNPICYFCGTRPTETEDHVPSRECFVDRVGPEGFTFPACRICNNGAGPLEQVIALYLLISNHSGKVSREQFIKLAKGVRNNTPKLLPKMELRANLARQHYRIKGLKLGPGEAFGEKPIATLPVGNGAAFELFARRLTCALFYKEIGRPIPLNFLIVVAWLPWSEEATTEAVKNANDLYSTLTMTNRRNTDIGDQFSYRWGAHPDGSVFGFLAKFAKSYYIFGAAAAPDLHATDTPAVAGWKRHADDVIFI